MTDISQTQDPLLGHSFQDYEFVELLGRGAFGAVYRSKHPRLQADVAVKYVYIHDKEQAMTAKNEINILAQLQHPNVVRIFDAFTFDTHQLIMIEFIRGGCLRDGMKKLQPDELLDKKVVIEGAKQIASALEYIHSRGVLHLDLKPENILLDQQSATTPTRFILTDFGIARFTHTIGGNVTAWGGTPLYMSPEHFGFGVGKTDWRSDIYSLGVILYELLVGYPPFRGMELGLLANMHASEEPLPFPRALNIPPIIETLVMKTLEKTPEERFQSAGELYQALEAVQYSLVQGGNSGVVPEITLTHFVQEHIQEFEGRRDNQAELQAEDIEEDVTAPSASLVIMYPDGKEGNYSITSLSFVIGRSSKADLTLRYDQISRRHAQIDIDAHGQIFITDLDSINHTYLNGKVINPNERILWNSGDYVTIQGVSMTWQHDVLAAIAKAPEHTINSAEMLHLLDKAHEQQRVPLVLFDLTPEIIHVEPEKPVRVHVSVATENTPSAFYDLRISGHDIDSRWYTLPAGRVIEGNGQARFELTIHAPTLGTFGGRTFEALVEVVADNPDIPSVFRVIKIVVAQRMRFGVTVDSKEITHKWFGRSSRLSISNNGNYAERFDIFVEASDQLTMRPTPSNIDIDSGQTGDVRINFRPKRGASRMGRLLYTLTVVSSNTGMTERINGSYVFRRGTSRFSLSSFIFLLVLITVLGIGSYQLITGKDIATILQQLLDFGRDLLQSIGVQ